MDKDAPQSEQPYPISIHGQLKMLPYRCLNEESAYKRGGGGGGDRYGQFSFLTFSPSHRTNKMAAPPRRCKKRSLSHDIQH